MSNFSRISFRRSAAPSVRSTSGGTGSQQYQHASDSYHSMDSGDASSDEGDSLYTPVSDSAQLVEVVYPTGLGDSFQSNDGLGGRATAATAPHCSTTDHSFFSSPQRSPALSGFKEFLPSSASPLSGLSSSSLASSSLDNSLLCSTSLLDTRISLEDSSLDLYPSSTDSSFAPLHTSQKPDSTRHFFRPQIETNEMILSIRPSPPRKRPSDTLSPLSRIQLGQRPKLARISGPEFLPSTLGSSYCSRFPPDHRLRSDFVRTYALEAELGSGGYGFVMTARHRQEGREVAVKFISKDKIPRYGWATDSYGKEIPKEAWFLSRINHPAIVKFYDLYEDDAYFYVVMELHGTPWVRKAKKVDSRQCSRETCFVDEKAAHPDQNVSSKSSKNGRHTKGPLARPNFARRASHDLFECIEQSKNKRFSEEDAKYIFAQVVDVVDYLDRLGITHCDIKDENVVIDKDLKIKLVDFGSVVSVDPGQERPFYKSFYGTAAYASPEIIRDKPYQAPPAEVWALGVLLSFLITGMSPFPSEDDKRNGRIALDAGKISSECFDLMQRCLEVDPQSRADIAEVKAHPWLTSGLETLFLEQ